MEGNHEWAYLFDQWIRIFFCRTNEGVGVGEALGEGSFILILLANLPMAFLVFFWGVELIATLHFPARVFDAPTLVPADGSLAGSPLGDRTEIGIVRIGMSPSNLGMGEMKLSRTCIQTHKI
jgi:hypothetical protein